MFSPRFFNDQDDEIDEVIVRSNGQSCSRRSPQAALAAAEFEKLAQLGYQLKGSAGNLRITALDELAVDL